MSGGTQDFSNASMLELFRMEVDSHSAALNDGLVALAAGPVGPEVLEGLMRASHSIKGAARIVGLQHAVKVAHAMEDCFVAAQEGKLKLHADHVDTLLRGTDFLVRSGKDGTPQADLDTQSAEIVAALKGIKSGERSGTRKAVASVPAAVSAASTPAIVADNSLLDLFRSEIETNCQTLAEGFTKLEKNFANAELLTELRRAAHSVKGAARIVAMDPVTGVGLAMEEIIAAAVDGKSPMNAAKLAILRAGNELAMRMGAAAVSSGGNVTTLKQQFNADIQAWKQTIVAADAAPAAPATPAVPVLTDMTHISKNVVKSTTSSARLAAVAGNRGNKSNTVKLAEEGARAVRVNAASLSRLMGLAGESLVEAGFLSRFEQSLRLLQERQNELSFAIEKLNNQPITDRYEATLNAPLMHEIAQKSLACQALLAERMHAFEDFALRSDNLSHRLYREVIASRMRPFGDGIQQFPRMVHDVARTLGKKIRFEVIGKNTEVDRDILEKLEAPLNHLLRNAVDHGIESPQERIAAGKDEQGRIVLEAMHRGGMLSVTVTDDGRGVDLERVRRKIIDRKLTTAEIALRLTDAEVLEFLFLPGFSTAEKVTEISGRGVGLDVVQTMVQEVAGHIRIGSNLGQGCVFHVQLPITLSVVSALLVDISGEPYAFPLTRIDRVLRIPKSRIQTLENRQYIKIDGQSVGLITAQQIFDLDEDTAHGDEVAIVVIGSRTERYGIAVDRVLGERKVVVRPLDRRLGKVPNISAAALMEDGAPMLIVDIEDILHSVQALLAGGRLQKVTTKEVVKRSQHKRVLVVDDSLTVREVERKLLENKGYEVDLATDGAEGWNALRSGRYDLLITDVDMPRMNGIELVTMVRADARYEKLPVMIVSYKDREEDRLKGMEAGANYYLTKSSFQDESLLDAVVDLIGEAR